MWLTPSCSHAATALVGLARAHRVRDTVTKQRKTVRVVRIINGNVETNNAFVALEPHTRYAYARLSPQSPGASARGAGLKLTRVHGFALRAFFCCM